MWNLAVIATLVATLSTPHAATSPYPAILTMQRGLLFSSDGKALPWGTTLDGAQAKWVVIESRAAKVRWGVWQQKGAPGQFPVRSFDGGAHWKAAGPQLASDWAGGSLYYVNRVISESSSAVVMVSNSIIDVTTDSGHAWHQYLNVAANWSITHCATSAGRLCIRVGPASWASMPKNSYAVYYLQLPEYRWLRMTKSTG